MPKASVKTGNRRLLKLADFLDTLEPCLFNLAVITDNNEDKSKEDKLVALKEMQCGTAACAIGWCPKVFPKLAKWKLPEYEDDYNVYSKKSGNTDFWFAVEAFGLVGYDDAYGLFHPDNYDKGDKSKPKDVAKKIRKFVRSREKAKK